MNTVVAPHQYAAVLGGQSLIPVGAAVLGGLPGVKSRLASPNVKIRIAALSEALKYGEVGLDLIVQALRDDSMEVKIAAYLLLNPNFQLEIEEKDCGTCVIHRSAYIGLSKEKEWTENGEFLEGLYIWCVRTMGAIYSCENGSHQSAFGYKTAAEAARSLIKNYKIIGISPRGVAIFRPALRKKTTKRKPTLKEKDGILKQALFKSGVSG